MVVKLCVPLFLFACHTSSSSATPGSASGETGVPTQPVVRTGTAPQQKAAEVPDPPAPGEIHDPAAAPGPIEAATPAGAGSAAKPGIGENCGAGDACADGMTCVSYYGIAGRRGPEFKSCEIRCDGDRKAACPTGRSCVTVSDGPGRVCR
jgi:hypothetical protein